MTAPACLCGHGEWCDVCMPKPFGGHDTAAAPRTFDEITDATKGVEDAAVRAELQRRFRRPKSGRMLKLAKAAQDRGDNEIAEMWVRRALQ